MVKLLFAGAVRGDLKTLADRVAALNSSKHGPFDAVLCAGDFFGSSEPAEGGEPGGDTAASSAISAFLSGSEIFPIPLYFVASKHGHPALRAEGGDLCSNITFLGGAGVRTIPDRPDGIRVAFLSGDSQDLASASAGPAGNAEGSANAAPSSVSEERRWLPTAADLDRLSQSASERESPAAVVDVLLTCDWPQHVLTGLESAQLPSLPIDSAAYSAPAAELCATLKPRYHFASSQDCFFQRVPFACGQSGSGSFTRFVALGWVKADSSDKTKKWLHALNLEAAANAASSSTAVAAAAAPAIVTASPFAAVAGGISLSSTSGPAPSYPEDLPAPYGTGPLTAEQIARITAEEAALPTQHFFAPRGGRGAAQRPRKRRKPRYNVAPRGDCWYCLASPSCETHLIISVSEDVYISLPKGTLNAQHCQIIPVSHEPSLAMVEYDVLDKVVAFKSSVTKFFESFDCVAIFFERNIIFEKALQRHAFLEAIPVPKATCDALKALIATEAKRCGIDFNIELPEVAEGKHPGLTEAARKDGLGRLRAYADEEHITEEQEYYFLEVSGGVFSPHLFRVPQDLPSEKRLRLPLHFARFIACAVLGCMNRVNWKGCLVPEDMERRMASDFQDAFKSYDPFAPSEAASDPV